MLNISNLDNGQQSKDGFIKSMVLFIILLVYYQLLILILGIKIDTRCKDFTGDLLKMTKI